MNVKYKEDVFVYRKGALGDTIFFIPFLFSLRKVFRQIFFAGNYLYRDLFFGIDFINFLDADSTFVFNLMRGKENLEVNSFYIFSKAFDKIRDNYFIYEPLQENTWVYKYPYDCISVNFEKENIYFPVVFNEKLFSLIKNKKIVLFHPGSGGNRKRWSLGNFFVIEEFLKKIGYEVIYILGESETHLLKFFGNRKIVYNSSFSDIIFLLQYAKIFIGGDSGIGHLAGVIGVDGFMLFGPSNDQIYRPYAGLKVIKSNNVDDIESSYIIDKLGGMIEKG
ncbi:MAG: hypothetical protein N2999_04475 [Proteobacteria bacterium]|nr:hypothetical protein [Pseudomonadota bacterium]